VGKDEGGKQRPKPKKDWSKKYVWCPETQQMASYAVCIYQRNRRCLGCNHTRVTLRFRRNKGETYARKS